MQEVNVGRAALNQEKQASVSRSEVSGLKYVVLVGQGSCRQWNLCMRC